MHDRQQILIFQNVMVNSLCAVNWCLCNILCRHIQQTVDMKTGPQRWDAAGADGLRGASLLRRLCPPQVVLHTHKLWDLLLVLPLSDLLLLILIKHKTSCVSFIHHPVCPDQQLQIQSIWGLITVRFVDVYVYAFRGHKKHIGLSFFFYLGI